MKLSFLLFLGVGLASAAQAQKAAESRSPKPPASRVEPVRELLHGREIVDPYRWLEGDNSNPERMGQVTPEVAAWTDAQNAHTRSVLDALPGRAQVEERLRQLMEIGTVSKPDMRGNRYFFAKREGSQNQAVYYWREGARGETKTLIDPAVLDPSGLTTVTWVSPSRDGRLAAYGTYSAGDENTTLHLLEVDSGKKLPLEIPNKVLPPEWLPDGSGFVYRNLSDPKNPYSGQVMFHRMGEPVTNDALLMRQFTKQENEKLATTFGPWGSLSTDGRWLVLSYWTGTRSNDLWVADFELFRKSGRLVKHEVSLGRDGTAFGWASGDTLFVQTIQGAPNGRIDAYDLKALGGRETPGSSALAARVIVPERADTVIEAVAEGRGVLAVAYLRNAANALELFAFDGRPLGALKLPGIGSASIAAESDRTEAFVQFTSFNYPTTIFRVDLAKPSAEPELWERPDVPVDPATVEVEQVWYPSKDGTKVSMFLVYRKGLVRDGNNPVNLNGYGGFNVSVTPQFIATQFHWFEAGGLLALPNLRGGGEYGDAWHEAGMLAKKQNTIDDFIAAAEWLIAQKYTRPERLAISGGSNGGLLTGAAITQRPELFRVALVAVPLLDMLRYEKFLMARYWVPEYGTAEDPTHVGFLAAYSPYQQVKDGTRYPAVLLTAGENDTRVHALHARKMAARLQAVAAGVPDAAPVLLWVDRESGHGQGKPLNLRVRDAADQRIFFLWQLGMLK